MRRSTISTTCCARINISRACCGAAPAFALETRHVERRRVGQHPEHRGPVDVHPPHARPVRRHGRQVGQVEALLGEGRLGIQASQQPVHAPVLFERPLPVHQHGQAVFKAQFPQVRLPQLLGEGVGHGGQLCRRIDLDGTGNRARASPPAADQTDLEPGHFLHDVRQHFRKRIGKDGFESIFQMSVGLHGQAALEGSVNIDTTVQEKNITYPTDAKLAIKIINRLNKIAKKHGIQQRRTYNKEVKSLRLDIRHFRHVKKRAKATRALKRLRTIAGALIRELRRKLSKYCLFERYQKDFLLYERVLSQKPKDKNKIYSLHEPQVYCIAKGKDHKQYEYGNKVSVASTAKGNLIVGVVSHENNIHDGHTLPEVLEHIKASRGKGVKRGVVDRGYRGRNEVNGTEIILPKKPLKRDNRYQRDKKRKQCRRRAAIEPIIGHLKSDYRLSRNFLKGIAGDEINLLLAATAWNLRKWLIAFLALLLPGFLAARLPG